MSDKNNVVWSEGMFLRPQHFQQHDRYIDSLVQGRCGGLQSYDWGLKSLVIDQKQLKIGKFAVLACQGIFPDGTPFDLPLENLLPLPIDIGIEVRDCLVYLALPITQPGAPAVAESGATHSFTRYLASEQEVGDSTSLTNSVAALMLAGLNTRLLLESQERAGYVCLALARILESREGKSVILDEQFIPSFVDCNANSVLKGYLSELCGLLHSRGEALGVRASEMAVGGISEIANFLLLQTINRLEPLFQHLQTLPALHPESFYRLILQLAGELATFNRKSKRPLTFGPYLHEDLQSTFRPVMEEVRTLLALVMEESAIAIPLLPLRDGKSGARISDSNLLKNAMFVLAVNAQLPPEQLRRLFPNQVRLSPVEYINDLIRDVLPGITIHPMPHVPPQIRYHAGFVYFELDKQSKLWQPLQQSGALAIHVAGDFPGLELELWAIRAG